MPRRLQLILMLLSSSVSHAALTKDIDAGDSRSAATIHADYVYASFVSDPEDLKYVDHHNGSDSGAGTSSSPWKTIKYGVSQLSPGDTLLVKYTASEIPTQIKLTGDAAANGTSTNPITIRGLRGPNGQRVRLVLPDDLEPVFMMDRSFWIVDGFEIHGKWHVQNLVRLNAASTAIKNCLIRGGAKDGVFVDAPKTLVQGNEIREIYESNNRTNTSCSNHSTCGPLNICAPTEGQSGTSGKCAQRQDGHGVVIISGADDVMIRDNTIVNVSGDGVQCAGKSESGLENMDPTNITLQNNTMYKTPTHYLYGENAIDIKDCSRVSVLGGRYYGAREIDGTGNTSHGNLMVLHYGADRVLVDGAEFSNACAGIAVGSEGQSASNLVIRRTLLHDFYRNRNDCSSNDARGLGIRLSTVTGVDLYQITVDRADNAALSFKSGLGASDVDLWNSILAAAGSGYWIKASPGDISQFESDHNLYWADFNQSRFYCSGAMGMSGWRSSSCDEVGGLDDNSTSTVEPGFVDRASANYALHDESGAIDTGMQYAGAASCGPPDKGAFEKCDLGSTPSSDGGTPPPPAIDGGSPPPSDAPTWVTQFGTSADDYVYGSVVTSTDEIVVTGYSSGAIDYTNQGGKDAFVRKYDATGAYVWGRQLGNSGEEHAFGIAIDSSDDVVIGGRTSNALYTSYAGGDYDGFLSKFDSAGTRQWIAMIGSSAHDEVKAVASDGVNFFVAGFTDGQLATPNDTFATIPPPGGARDIFVAKFDSSGTLLWVRQLGTTEDDQGLGLTATSSGDVYVAGFTYGTFDGEESFGGSDVFIAKYDASGDAQWVRQWGSPGDDFAFAIAASQTGYVSMAGSTTGSLAFTHQGEVDAFAARWTSAGTLDWSRQVGSGHSEWAYGVAVDAYGQTYISGTNTGPLYSNYQAGYDVFVSKFEQDGSRQWIRHLGSTSDEVSLALSVSGDGSVYASGGTLGTLDGLSSGGKDGFIAKFSTTNDRPEVAWYAGDFRYLPEVEMDVFLRFSDLDHPRAGAYGRITPTRKANFTAFANALLDSVDAMMSSSGVVDWCDVLDKADATNYTVQRLFDTGTGRYFIYAADTTSNGQAYFLLNPSAKRNVVVQVSHSGFESNTSRQGIGAFLSLGARALFVNKEHRCSDPDATSCQSSVSTSVCGGAYRESDVAHDTRNTFHTLHEIMSARDSVTKFVQLHGMSDISGAANGVVLASDTTTRDVELSSPAVRFATYLRAVIDADSHPGDSTKINACQEDSVNYSLCGTTNIQGRFTNGSANVCSSSANAVGERFLHLEQIGDIRDAIASDDGYNWTQVVDAVRATWPECNMNDGDVDCSLGPSPLPRYADWVCP